MGAFTDFEQSKVNMVQGVVGVHRCGTEWLAILDRATAPTEQRPYSGSEPKAVRTIERVRWIDTDFHEKGLFLLETVSGRKKLNETIVAVNSIG